MYNKALTHGFHAKEELRECPSLLCMVLYVIYDSEFMHTIYKHVLISS